MDLVTVWESSRNPIAQIFMDRTLSPLSSGEPADYTAWRKSALGCVRLLYVQPSHAVSKRDYIVKDPP